MQAFRSRGPKFDYKKTNLLRRQPWATKRPRCTRCSRSWRKGLALSGRAWRPERPRKMMAFLTERQPLASTKQRRCSQAQANKEIRRLLSRESRSRVSLAFSSHCDEASGCSGAPTTNGIGRRTVNHSSQLYERDASCIHVFISYQIFSFSVSKATAF